MGNLGKSTVSTKFTTKSDVSNLPLMINYTSGFLPVKNQLGCGSCYGKILLKKTLLHFVII